MSRVIQGTAVGAALALLASGGLMLASQARAGDVSGAVRSNEEVKAKAGEGARAPYWQEWNGLIEPKKAAVDYAREVSAVLIGPVASKDATTVSLRDGTLSPSTIVAQIGTTLRIRNEDDFGHALYAEGLKSFDGVETSPGATRSIVMEQTGVFPLRDKNAPYVRGYLHVVAKLAQTANPSSNGEYTFKDVPNGNYTVKVFRADQEVSSAEVEVSSSKTLTLDSISVALKPAK